MIRDTRTVAPAAFRPAAMAALGTLFRLGYTIQTSLQPYDDAWDVHFYGPGYVGGAHGVLRVGARSGRLLCGYVCRHGEARPREDLRRPTDLHRVARELPPIPSTVAPSAALSLRRAWPRCGCGSVLNRWPNQCIAVRPDIRGSLVIGEQPRA